MMFSPFYNSHVCMDGYNLNSLLKKNNNNNNNQTVKYKNINQRYISMKKCV